MSEPPADEPLPISLPAADWLLVLRSLKTAVHALSVAYLVPLDPEGDGERARVVQAVARQTADDIAEVVARVRAQLPEGLTR